MYTKRAYMVIGRFQGFTTAHNGIIWEAKDDARSSWGVIEPPTVVAGIVCGEKSSEDKDKNPFHFTERVWMIRQCHPEIMCLRLPTGFLGNAMEIFFGLGFKLLRVYIGGDRKETYVKQVESYKYDIEIKSVPRYDNISATKVRNALYKDDKEKFEQFSPKELHRHYEKIKIIYDINKAFPQGPFYGHWVMGEETGA